MGLLTSHSKDSITIGISATRRQSLRQDADDSFGTGMMVVLLKLAGTTAWLNEVFNMSVRVSGSCTVVSLGSLSGMSSGPATLHGLTLESVLLTSAPVTESYCSPRAGVTLCGCVVQSLKHIGAKEMDVSFFLDWQICYYGYMDLLFCVITTDLHKAFSSILRC